LNGWTVNASPYVTSPATSPPEDCSASKSARMPPGFINAMTALIGRPVLLLIVFAARYVTSAPPKPSPSWQRSTGWHPPFCIRMSSSTPSSNSWLPTELTCSPISFIGSIVVLVSATSAR
jgi:hypothetical protein